MRVRKAIIWVSLVCMCVCVCGNISVSSLKRLYTFMLLLCSEILQDWEPFMLSSMDDPYCPAITMSFYLFLYLALMPGGGASGLYSSLWHVWFSKPFLLISATFFQLVLTTFDISSGKTFVCLPPSPVCQLCVTEINGSVVNHCCEFLYLLIFSLI